MINDLRHAFRGLRRDRGFVIVAVLGIVPADPLTFGATIAAMSILGVGACWLPARRAAHLDPLVALRTD